MSVVRRTSHSHTCFWGFSYLGWRCFPHPWFWSSPIMMAWLCIYHDNVWGLQFFLSGSSSCYHINFRILSEYFIARIYNQLSCFFSNESMVEYDLWEFWIDNSFADCIDSGFTFWISVLRTSHSVLVCIFFAMPLGMKVMLDLFLCDSFIYYQGVGVAAIALFRAYVDCYACLSQWSQWPMYVTASLLVISFTRETKDCVPGWCCINYSYKVS